MKDKIKIVAGIGVVVAVAATLIIYMLATGGQDPSAYLLITIPIVIVLSASYILWDRVKSMRAGLPQEDERSKKVNYKAGYYGFIAAIWSAVGSNTISVMLYDEDLRGGLVTASVVLVSGLTFVIAYLYFQYKGDVE
ncbi:MAG: DUF2178 domain-containing protein [Thermoplasmata archaeon]|nr:MAG: DUF2178 domain-containing protein [Thermoplasmata archaeon]